MWSPPGLCRQMSGANVLADQLDSDWQSFDQIRARLGQDCAEKLIFAARLAVFILGASRASQKRQLDSN